MKIRARATNVFILQTLDFDRITQLIKAIPTALFHYKDEYGQAHGRTPTIWDINTNKLYRKETPYQRETELSITEAANIMQDLKTWLIRHAGTFMIIHYVWSESQAQSLTPQLISISQDPNVYGSNSLIAVFTASEYLFPETLLKFCHVINIPISTDEERRKKLQEIVKAITMVRPEIKLTVPQEVIIASRGLTLKETESAALESIFRYRQLKKEVFTEYKQSLFKKRGLTLTYPEVTFDHIGGYEYLKRYFRNRLKLAITNPKLLSKYGLEPPRGILLYGPPGTGKSFIASALAAEIGIPMVRLNPSDFLRGIVGETEARVREITKLLESLAPVIVFMDEFESIGMARGVQAVTDSGVTRRLQNMLLEWLGDRHRKAFIIGATNFIEQVDSAFLRPGRIDEIVPMLYPDEEARYQILKIHTSKLRKIPLHKSVDLKQIAAKTSFWTGAELEKLCLSAAQLALDEKAEYVTQEHFKKAMETLTIDQAQREQQLKNMIETLKRMENVNQVILREALENIRKTPKDRLAQVAAEI